MGHWKGYTYEELKLKHCHPRMQRFLKNKHVKCRRVMVNARTIKIKINKPRSNLNLITNIVSVASIRQKLVTMELWPPSQPFL